MAIVDIRLQSFRSYEDQSFELSPSVNIIVGPNASGKTNLLESVLVVARGGSYRARDNELIMFDKPWSRLDAHFDSGTRIVKLLRENQTKKVFEIEGKVLSRLTHKYALPVVLFEPNHLQLLSGSPESRRNYLDDLLEQTNPTYGSVRRQYKRTLAQRNALLKLGSSAAAAQMFPWNIRLTELAGSIVRQRLELIEAIQSQLTPLYRELSKTEVLVTVDYLAKCSPDHYETQMLQKLEASIELDCMRGFTAIGPHREDFTVLFDGRLAALTASRGETRTVVLALKIIELQILERSQGKTPLLLLDDVFSELDGARRRLLTHYLESYQSFITTTDADVVLKHFTTAANIIPMTN